MLSLCHLSVRLPPSGLRWLLQLQASRLHCSRKGEKDQDAWPPFASHWPEPGYTATSSCGGAGVTVLIQASRMPEERRRYLTVAFNLHFPCGSRVGMVTPGAPCQESQLARGLHLPGLPPAISLSTSRDGRGPRTFGGDPAVGPQDSGPAVPKASTPNSGQCLTTPNETHFFTVGLRRVFIMPMCVALTPECLGLFSGSILHATHFAVLTVPEGPPSCAVGSSSPLQPLKPLH